MTPYARDPATADLHEPVGPGACVALAVALFTVIACLTAWFATPSVPGVDDIELVPYVSGRLPLTLGWLWSQYFEHRIPLSKLVVVSLHRATGMDMVTGALCNVGVSVAATVVALIVLRRLRGATSYVDVVVPMSLLNPGVSENFISPFQSCFVTAALLAVLAGAAVTRPAPSLDARPLILTGCAIFLLAFAGNANLPLAAALASWLACLAVVPLAPPLRPSSRVAAVVASLGTFLLLGAFVTGYQRCHDYPPSPGPLATLRGTLLLLTTSLGGPGLAFGPGGYVAGGLLAGLGGVVVSGLVGTVRRRPDLRGQHGGLLAVILSYFLLALIIAHVRVGMPPPHFLASRYGGLLGPLVVWICAGAVVAWPRTLRGRLVQTSVGLLIASALMGNITYAMAMFRLRYSLAQAQREDTAARMPVAYYAATYPYTKSMEGHARLLQEAANARLAAWRLAPPPMIATVDSWFSSVLDSVWRLKRHAPLQDGELGGRMASTLTTDSLILVPGDSDSTLRLHVRPARAFAVHVLRADLEASTLSWVSVDFTTVDDHGLAVAQRSVSKLGSSRRVLYVRLGSKLRGPVVLNFSRAGVPYVVRGLEVRARSPGGD